jgi:hypothetical protein
VRHRASVLRQLIIASRQGLDGLNLVAVARGDLAAASSEKLQAKHASLNRS